MKTKKPASTRDHPAVTRRMFISILGWYDCARRSESSYVTSGTTENFKVMTAVFRIYPQKNTLKKTSRPENAER
jgi:hypothetical protein